MLTEPYSRLLVQPQLSTAVVRLLVLLSAGFEECIAEGAL